jgi:hypothetical protein
VAFVRKKKTTSGVVYQVVESRREGKKVHQKVLVSLRYAPTIARALQVLEKQIAIYKHTNYVLELDRQEERLRAIQRQTGLP